MSDAFIGAIIGGLIAALPGLVSALLVLINSNDIVQKAYYIGNAIKASGNSGQRSNISDFEVEAIRSYIHQQFSRSLPTE